MSHQKLRPYWWLEIFQQSNAVRQGSGSWIDWNSKFNRLVEFYEKAVPCLSSHIEAIEPASKANMLEKFNLSRKFLIQIYNALLHSVSIKPLLCEK